MTTPPSGTVRPELEAIIRRELAPDESVIWQTQPRADAYALWARPLFSRIGWFFSGLGAVWLVMFIVFFPTAREQGVLIDGERRPLTAVHMVVFPTVGVAQIVIGVLIRRVPRLLGRGAATAAYALTNKRVLTVAESDQPFEGRELRVRSYGPSDLDRIERTDRADGVGDLVFRPDLKETTSTGRTAGRPHGLLGIERVAEVERIIRDTLRGWPTPLI